MTNLYRKLLLVLSLLIMSGWELAIAEPLTLSHTPSVHVRRQSLQSLEQEAWQEWVRGNKQTTFDLWDQLQAQLQLQGDRRLEIETLGRIGAIAWEDNQIQQVEQITTRLANIADNELKTDYNLLLPLAMAYEQLRDSPRAIALYRRHVEGLANPYKPGILRRIAELALAWFQREDALGALQEIDGLSALNFEDRETLASLYEYFEQPEQAIPLQRDLAAFYLQIQDVPQLIRTYQQLGANYQKLEDNAQAIRYSRSAFTLAWEMGYFAAAESALTQLGDLYLIQGKQDAGIQVYEQLITVQQASYDRFGMMQTYGRLGQLYETASRIPQALVSFQKGLAIAKELNHSIYDFTLAIETLPTQ